MKHAVKSLHTENFKWIELDKTVTKGLRGLGFALLAPMEMHQLSPGTIDIGGCIVIIKGATMAVNVTDGCIWCQMN
jgi:hypothetical protein